MLRFQAKASAVRVEHAALAADCAVKKVAAVKLDSRLSCQNLQNSPARGFIDFRGRLQLSVGSLVQNPVMIVSLPEFQLLVVLIDFARRWLLASQNRRDRRQPGAIPRLGSGWNLPE